MSRTGGAGDRGLRALVDLWCFAGANKPDGDLAGMERELSPEEHARVAPAALRKA